MILATTNEHNFFTQRLGISHGAAANPVAKKKSIIQATNLLPQKWYFS